MSDKISEYKFVISTLIFEYCFYEIAIESLRIRAGAEGIAYHQNVRKIRKICMIALLGPIKHCWLLGVGVITVHDDDTMLEKHTHSLSLFRLFTTIY